MSKAICSIDDCERATLCRGWCYSHYERWRRFGDPQATPVRERLVRPDSCTECGSKDLAGGAKGRCNPCYQSWRANRRSDSPRCTVPDCRKPAITEGICEKHRGRLRRTGTLEGVGRGTLNKKDVVEYEAAHHRVVAVKGRAKEHRCDHCGDRAQDWAYDHLDPEALVGVRNGCLYSLSPDHYIPLCKPCHKRFDIDWSRRASLAS